MTQEIDRFSVCIAGAGVIGLSIAYELSQSPRFSNGSIVILDQASSFGQQTSSRNSEVIHAGIYYPRDSLKARLCVRGKQLLYEYCDSYDIPFKRIGKCIISSDTESDSLEELKSRAEGNGVEDLVFWKQQRLQAEEPAVSARHALFSPSTGIVDSHSYMQSLLHQAEARGVLFAPLTRIETISRHNGGFELNTSIARGSVQESYSLGCEIFINCAGLQAQSLADCIQGVRPVQIPRLYPCKGDYFAYTGKNPFQHLIYPLPEANTQGLGVHSTTDMSGQCRFGPDTEYVDDIYYDVDASKVPAFAEAISSYFPAIDPARLTPSYSGIRPKLAGPGIAVADFVIQTPADNEEQGLFQFFGIESPGLTASLAIAEYIAGRL